VCGEDMCVCVLYVHVFRWWWCMLEDVYSKAVEEKCCGMGVELERWRKIKSSSEVVPCSTGRHGWVVAVAVVGQRGWQ